MPKEADHSESVDRSSRSSDSASSPRMKSPAERASLHRQLARQASDTARLLLKFGSVQSSSIYRVLEIEHERAAAGIERRNESSGEITLRKPGIDIET